MTDPRHEWQPLPLVANRIKSVPNQLVIICRFHQYVEPLFGQAKLPPKTVQLRASDGGLPAPGDPLGLEVPDPRHPREDLQRDLVREPGDKPRVVMATRRNRRQPQLLGGFWSRSFAVLPWLVLAGLGAQERPHLNSLATFYCSAQGQEEHERRIWWRVEHSNPSFKNSYMLVEKPYPLRDGT